MGRVSRFFSERSFISINNMIHKLRNELQEFNVFIVRLCGLFLIYFWFYCLKEFFLSVGDRLVWSPEYP